MAVYSGFRFIFPLGSTKSAKSYIFLPAFKKFPKEKNLLTFFRLVKSHSDNQISLFNSNSFIRNLPQAHPKKWNAFKDYCKQDVSVERAIHNRLIKFAPPDSEHKLWCLDQKINSFGVLIDFDFVNAVLAIDSAIQNYAR